MGLLSKLLPRDSKFFPLFQEVGENFLRAVNALGEFADAPPGEERLRIARHIVDIEHDNDVVTHRIFDELHKTFITPFDREDIHQLASEADDVLDYLCAAVRRCDVLGIGDLTPHMLKQIEVLARCMTVVAAVLESLPSLSRGGGDFAGRARELHILESEADAIHMQALQELFADATDPIHVIRWNDVYETMEEAVDSCQRVANVAEGVAIKYA